MNEVVILIVVIILAIIMVAIIIVVAIIRAILITVIIIVVISLAFFQATGVSSQPKVSLARSLPASDTLPCVRSCPHHRL